MPKPSGLQSTVIYGIKNCDTVKKACKWLDKNAIDFDFHDFRADGLTASTIKDWIKLDPPVALINKRSTSWKQLSSTQRDAIEAIIADNTSLGHVKAAKLKMLSDILLDNPTLIKRPVTTGTDAKKASVLHIGFSDKQFAEIFSA